MKAVQKLVKRLQRFLSEEARHDQTELLRVKEKIDKLKKKIRRLERLEEACRNSKKRQRLQEERELAQAVRKKAHAHYRALRDKRSKKVA